MIFYFSGTGNSKMIAQWLNEVMHDELIAINHATSIKKLSCTGKSLGFICPVYGWGLPLYVEKFIEKLPTSFFNQPEYTFFILTCGDDIGRSDELLRKMWKNKGGGRVECFSLRMRNTYVCLPGFDIDNINVEKEKESHARTVISDIASRIVRQQPTSATDVTPGAFPWIKSYVLRPLFNKFLVNDRYFHLNKESCIRCGRCVQLCPTSNISFGPEGTPHWNGNCTQCLACYHGCPRHAINFGKYTESKGQVKINF